MENIGQICMCQFTRHQWLLSFMLSLQKFYLKGRWPFRAKGKSECFLLTCPSPLCHILCCSLQVKLMKYICKQLQCKRKVPDTERPEALDSYPHLRDWLRTVNLRPELIQVHQAVLYYYQSILAGVKQFALCVSYWCVSSMCTLYPVLVCMRNAWLVL